MTFKNFLACRYLVVAMTMLCAGTITIFPALAANAPVSAGTVSENDYRDLSTLNQFTRIVYKNRWKGIAATDVLEQFSAFNGATSSPALRDTWRDVLLGDFNGMVIQDNKQQALLMGERIRLLNRMGFFDEAVRLYQLASTLKPVPENIVHQGVDALAFSGSADGACLEIMMAERNFTGDAWQQDAAMCAAYFGDSKEADTYYNQALPNAGKIYAPTYEMLSGQSTKEINVPLPPLWRTLLLTQGATVTSGVLKEADAQTLASLAASHHVPLETRLAAAGRAAEHGAIGFDRLRILYETKYPDDKGFADKITAAINGQELSQEQYYTAARFTFAGKDRATIVKNAFKYLKPATNIKSQVYGWIVDKLTLQVNTIGWFAPEGYANMIATNRAASAKMYFDAGNLQNTPFALIEALQENTSWSRENEQRWEKAVTDKHGAAAKAKIADYLDLVKAYDQENKLGLYTPVESPEGIVVPVAIDRSLQRGGHGLTLITALNILSQEKQLANFDNRMFANVIEVMTREGLYGERKKITLEFLIQSML